MGTFEPIRRRERFSFDRVNVCTKRPFRANNGDRLQDGAPECAVREGVRRRRLSHVPR